MRQPKVDQLVELTCINYSHVKICMCNILFIDVMLNTAFRVDAWLCRLSSADLLPKEEFVSGGMNDSYISKTYSSLLALVVCYADDTNSEGM